MTSIVGYKTEIGFSEIKALIICTISVIYTKLFIGKMDSFHTFPFSGAIV